MINTFIIVKQKIYSSFTMKGAFDPVLFHDWHLFITDFTV